MSYSPASSPARPLLTFAVASCNQESFVREAVDAAFSQTYSPLQIILSDDCSNDRSFEIMREMAAAYRGPHSVELNRNPVRKSIGGHFNRVGELSRGELIVIAAADDVSLPHRTAAVHDAWVRDGKKATSVHSDFIQIDAKGRTIEQIHKPHSEPGMLHGQARTQQMDAMGFVQTLLPMVVGCAHAFSPRLARIFGQMPDHITHEDDVLAFRSVLAGSVLYINEALVKYRLHGANMYLGGTGRATNLKDLESEEDRFRRYFKNRETMYGAFLRDIKTAGQSHIIDPAECARALGEAERMRRRFALMSRFLESGLLEKCRILRTLRQEGMDSRETRALLRRLLPRPILLRVRLAMNCLAASRPVVRPAR